MVNILSWNVRGLNGLNKQKEVKLICNENNVGLIGLLETKIKFNRVPEIARTIFAGVWVVWRPDIYNVTIKGIISQAISCQATFVPLQLIFLITFVYAYNLKEDRKELWKYLCSISQGNNIPWIVLGDFNDVLHTGDRIGDNPILYVEVVDFSNCIDSCGLSELPSIGGQYTWNDRQ
ncbi:uncharacterized protein LOC142166136 [Nicotiana tabacum]|uniref:Uncharacterized protein LOC142166136 n=1 Tax=Nicotiana tabacum TaxID=4097 RepID=A0AC58S6N6_TOBAC